MYVCTHVIRNTHITYISYVCIIGMRSFKRCQTSFHNSYSILGMSRPPDKLNPRNEAPQRRYPKPKRFQGFVPLRLALLAACLGWLSRKNLRSTLLPYGFAKRLSKKPTYGPIDFSNDLLMAKCKNQESLVRLKHDYSGEFS